VAAVPVVVELVNVDLPAEGIAVNAESFRGAGLIAVGPFEDALDEALFEFADGLVKEDSAFYHLYD
jgi:hypothetical protein